MKTIAHFTLDNPPTKYIIPRKRAKYDKDGKLITQDVYYLTANIFYDGTHWAVKSKVVNFAKDYLILYLNHIPKILKCKLEITYHSPRDNFDLDNKAYFWTKILLDLLKTPSDKQLYNAALKNSKIKTVSVLEDDTVKYIDNINMSYKRGAHKLEIKLIGHLKPEQAKFEL